MSNLETKLKQIRKSIGIDIVCTVEIRRNGKINILKIETDESDSCQIPDEPEDVSDVPFDLLNNKQKLCKGITYLG